MSRQPSKATILLICILTVTLVSSFYQAPQVKATTVTNTVYIYPILDATLLQSVNETGNYYDSAWGRPTGVIHNSDNYLTVSQSVLGVYRSYLFFDTTTIPASATINNATLSLYILDESSFSDFNITIQSGSGAYPHNPLITADYFYSYYSGNYGSVSTSEMTENQYLNISVTDTSIIQANGQTKLVIRNNNEINHITPSTEEKVQFASYENSLTTTGPKLTVTYTVTGSGYSVTGPYYENGEVVNGTAEVTFTYANGLTENYTLDGTDGAADTATFNLAYAPQSFSYSATGALNYTRLYYFPPGTTSAALNLYVTSPDETAQIYQFTISDYSGITNPYIGLTKTLNGTTQYIEYKPITVSTISFVMEQWKNYNIIINCDQGTYSVPFSAEASFYTNLNVAPLLFEQTDLATNFTAYSEEYNSTTIRTTYVDYDSITSELSITIMHGSGAIEVDYNNTISSFNNTYPSGSYLLDWTSRDSEVSYLVAINATRNGVLYSWVYSIPSPAPQSPFTGVFDFLGDWPNGVDPAQAIIGLIIIISGVGIFSYLGTAIGCAFSWIMAAILTALGWYTISAPLLVFSAVVTALIYLDESKKSAREV